MSFSAWDRRAWGMEGPCAGKDAGELPDFLAEEKLGGVQ